MKGGRKKELPERKPCAWPECGTLFRPYRKDKEFCSQSCRNAAWRAQNPRSKVMMVTVTETCGKCGYEQKVTRRATEEEMAGLRK